MDNQPTSTPPPRILSIQLNTCRTNFMVGTDTGFAMYSVNPLQQVYSRDLGGGIGIAVQLHETNFVGLVGGGDNPAFPVNMFMLWNDYTKKVIAERREKDTIVAVRINNEVAAVLTRRRVMLYGMEKLDLKRTIKTCSNPTGVCALSSGKGCVFLCPGLEEGTVNIVDYVANTERTVRCHDTALRSITLNTTYEGTDRRAHSSGDSVFATTSEKGTLIRVFDVGTQTKLKELRRGHDECEIYGVEFSNDSKCLVVTSTKGNVHVYSLTKDYENVSSRASFLRGLSGYLGSKWSPFAIPFAVDVRHIACITAVVKPSTTSSTSSTPTTPNSASSDDAYQLLVLSHDGSYAVHNLWFKDNISTPYMEGLIKDIPLTLTYAQAAASKSTKTVVAELEDVQTSLAEQLSTSEKNAVRKRLIEEQRAKKAAASTSTPTPTPPT